MSALNLVQEQCYQDWDHDMIGLTTRLILQIISWYQGHLKNVLISTIGSDYITLASGRPEPILNENI